MIRETIKDFLGNNFHYTETILVDDLTDFIHEQMFMANQRGYEKGVIDSGKIKEPSIEPVKYISVLDKV